MGPKSNNEAEYEALECELEDLAEDIRDSHAIGLKSQTDPSIEKLFQAHLSRIDSCFEKFQSCYLALKKLNKSLSKNFEHYLMLKSTTYDLYYETLSFGIKSSQDSKEFTDENIGEFSKSGNYFKLPSLNLPNFDGNVSNWPSFKDTFTSLIHCNSNISPVEKYHYLKSSLKGAAFQTIAAIPITSAGYNLAWEALLKRYDNKRILATNHLVKILNFKPLAKMNLSGLEQFSSVVLESANALLQMDIEDPAGFIICVLGLRLLDSTTREKFEAEQKDKTEIPGFKEFSAFIHQQFLQLQTTSITTPALNSENKPFRQSKNVFMSMGVPLGPNCPICAENHRILDCSRFRTLPPRQRYEKIKSLNRCLNCCSAGHKARECTSKISCRCCNSRHHTLLHFAKYSGNSKSQTGKGNLTPIGESRKLSNPSYLHPSDINTEANDSVKINNQSLPATKGTILSATQAGTEVLLGTAIARAKDKFGNFQPIRILIDCGSQRSFITTDCAHRLSLTTFPNKQSLVGLGNQTITGSDSLVICTLRPDRNDSPQISATAIVIDNICSNLPSSHVSCDLHKYLEEFELADPDFNDPRPIDFLLGADLFGEILKGESVKVPKSLLYAMNTIFGWVLLGKISSHKSKKATSLLIATKQAKGDLHDLIAKFWEVEEVASTHHANPLHVKCEDHFKQTHYRDEKGRYVVQLPFSAETNRLDKSKYGALQRFQKLEHKFAKNARLKEEYDKVITEYLERAYAEPAVRPGRCFMPHHGVTKDSTSSKLRVVFDASYSTFQGSLNDQLMIGPKLQNDIREVLLRFRFPRFVITTDISQMYLRILVSPLHRPFQHFFYRFDPTDAVIEYEFNRLPFGLACSPYLAMRVLKQLVLDEGEPYPLAAQSLKNNIYIDDILAGADTLEEALTLQKELIELLEKGGFSLKKWCGNAKQLMENVPSEALVSSVTLSNMEDSVVKILGMKWEPEHDILSYEVQLKPSVASKRGIMSCIARMYDPLGYLAPVVFRAKTILQGLWLSNLGWDDDLPGEMLNKWEEFFVQLPSLKEIQIPRCLFPKKIKNVSVVGFADASSVGYAAVVYFRIALDDGAIFAKLITAKTRLAPIKFLTIPRLELCAALLLTNTLNSLNPLLSTLPIKNHYLLSDSSIVLHWLRMPGYRLKTFVANRVSKILNSSSLNSWHHVRSEENMADVASRGCNPSMLADNLSWWNGPQWLTFPSSEWPLQCQENHNLQEEDLPELRPVTALLSLNEASFFDTFVEKFSNFEKLVRVWAFVLRFVNNLRTSKEIRSNGPINLKERFNSIHSLIKGIQQYHFRPNPPTDSHAPTYLRQLQPFLDSQGITRVGGRIQNAPLPYEMKHPILLPTKCHFVNLLIDYHHIIYLHAGPQLLLSSIRRQYWIPSVRRRIRSRIHQCFRCHRLRLSTYAPLMGNLPISRFEQGRAFLNTGIDFAGPIPIRESTRRKAALGKAYYALFICLGTKAVHIEVVSQLTTEAFLAGLDRFVARRGHPSKIFSDNATNFVGAKRHLETWAEWLNNKRSQNLIEQHLTSRGISWNFIPPLAPHFGGLWEAGVKSLKFHLSRILNHQPLTFEEMTTVATRVEAVLNSRPLSPITASLDDFDTLTPGHFLIGEPLVSVPEPDFTDRKPHLLTRWQFLRQCTSDLWKRWRLDYLTTLQNRRKWTIKNPNIEPGTLVILKEHNSPILSWPTGRVVECYPGKDGVVRVVKIKTTHGEFIRPVSRLAPLLPLEEKDLEK